MNKRLYVVYSADKLMELNGIKYSPQILKQGLLIVLIPFLVLAAVLTLLTFLSKTQETLSQHERNQSQLLSRCALTFNDWGETVAHLIGRAFSDNKAYDKGSASLVRKLQQEFSDIKTHAKSGPLANRVGTLETLCMESIESLEELPRAKALGVMANFETLQRMPPIFHRVYLLPSKVKFVLEDEKKELLLDRKRQDKQEKAIFRLATICICANIILSLVLIWYFARKITSRLQILTLRAGLMSRLEKLELPIKGTDEIAYLAAVLQKSSEQLIEAAEHRRAIFGMVAHDMRSPLSAGQLSLEVIEESLGDSISDNDLGGLRLARDKMIGILKHVNAILTVEQTKTAQLEVSQAGHRALTNSEELSAPFTSISTVNGSSNTAEGSSNTVDGSSNTANGSSITVDGSSITVDGSSITADGSSSTVDGSSNTAGGSSITVDGSSITADGSSSTVDGSSSTADGSFVTKSITHEKTQLPGEKSFWKNPIHYAQNLLTKPQIFHKVLLIVLIPIIFQGIFLFVFDRQIDSNHKLLKQQRTLSDISLMMNIIFLDSLKGTVAEAIYAISGEEKIRERAIRSFDIAIGEFPPDEFFTGTENSDWNGILKSWRKLLLTHKNEAGVIESIKKAASTNDVKERLHEIKPLQKTATTLRRNASNQFKKDSLDMKFLQDKQLEATRTLTVTLVIAVAANLLVTMILLLAFNRDIRRRLNLLVSNAANVSSPTFVFTNVEGSDELAYLNNILRQTQTELQNASRDRAALMREITVVIQTPLNESIIALKQFSESATDSLTEKMKRQLTRAQNNIERVLALVNDLLTMETLETGRVSIELAECNVKQFTDEAILAVNSLAKQKNIEIENLCSDAIIKADKSRLIQTVINYLANAIKFSPENTKIRVSEISSERTVRVCVSDEGPGMDEQTRNRVFERFFQAEGKEKKQGFGLGLSICSLIVQSHGGKLGCESEVGKGSTFWFEIPR